MDKVVVDLSSCVRTEATYVMISCCMHLDGLLVLRPFPISKIMVQRSRDAHEEFLCLERLRQHTVESLQNTQAGGNQEEDVAAISTLFTMDTDPDIWAAGRLLNCLWDSQVVKCESRPFSCDPRSYPPSAASSNKRMSDVPNTSTRVTKWPRFR